MKKAIIMYFLMDKDERIIYTESDRNRLEEMKKNFSNPNLQIVEMTGEYDENL